MEPYLLWLALVLCRIELLGFLRVVRDLSLALAEFLRRALGLFRVLFRRHVCGRKMGWAVNEVLTDEAWGSVR